ncbi:hypothetical protein DL771_004900 [Monosporascus sp. 5C6A]|nr:hypothetical protein DL771_004900 [Monosporascus sp. 5C6A]
MSSQVPKEEEPKLANPAQEQDKSIAASKEEAELEVAVIVDEDEGEPKFIDDDDDDEEEPKVVIDDEGERPYVKAYVTRPSFRVGDRVYLLRSSRVREGPYLVASIPGAGRATLCLENGTPVENGRPVPDSGLEAVQSGGRR